MLSEPVWLNGSRTISAAPKAQPSIPAWGTRLRVDRDLRARWKTIPPKAQIFRFLCADAQFVSASRPEVAIHRRAFSADALAHLFPGALPQAGYEAAPSAR